MEIRLFIPTDAQAQFIGTFTKDGRALYITWAGPGSPKVDSAVSAHRAAAASKQQVFEQKGTVADCKNLVLLGGLPYGDAKHNWVRDDFLFQVPGA